MKKFILLVSFLILSTILNDHQASGIRLIQRSLSLSPKEDQIHHVHDEENDLKRRSNVGMEASNTDHISEETGSNRKLMTKTSAPSSTSTTTTSTSKNDKNVHEEGNYKGEPTTTVLQKGNQSSRSIERSLVGKEENFNVNSSTVLPDHDHQHSQPDRTNVDPGHYPDILDIAGMDYSPAKRKPPIHN
ncbi:OLC1v1038128C1 [Oldenlandia corymbosa var. corymbosa]|uniref:OLC1v1038128C1 n=1 Tax=Oldenlandia corymbosa var. corymbosa TaxID=529605 RepID=A0AAV1D279_OLDCO|nr:OLC1v1038128C1 [Oldenlandia corymbosa var. corymbosa]